MAGRKPLRTENVGDLEKKAFRIDPVDATTVEKAVCDETAHIILDDILDAIGGSDSGNLSYSIQYNATTDVITYYEGGLAGTAVRTLTLTYQNARKKKVVSGEWVEL